MRIYPYDLITSNFFPFVWKIDSAWDPTSYLYTDERYKTTACPAFKEGSEVEIINKKEDGFTVKFSQATPSEDYVNDYNIFIKTD